MSSGEKEKRTRTRSGCLNCRRRRRKCDEARPTCLNCSKRDEVCQRGVRLSFRKENAQTLGDRIELDEDHPLGPERPSKRKKQYKIVDVTTDVVDQYQSKSPSSDLTAVFASRAKADQNNVVQVSKTQMVGEVDTPVRGDESPGSTSPSNARILNPLNRPASIDGQNGVGQQMHRQAWPIKNIAKTGIDTTIEVSPNLDITSPTASLTTNYNPTEDAAQNLLYLRQMQQDSTEHETISDPYSAIELNMSTPFPYGLDQITPESFFDDGVFLPGSTYHELHATLRRHLIDETNSGAQSRQISPQVEDEPRSLRHIGNSRLREQVEDSEPCNDRTPPLEISPEEEYRLWKIWFDEIAGWLDKFDNQRHFQHTLPIMAQSSDHLRFSILAVSARQSELKRSSKPTNQSLALYQQAIHLLLPQLHTRSTTVIASCVVLCVLEMLSCSPKAWRRHLDGCANLMQAVGITGFSGGVEQALFWCFARMDVCGGLIDSLTTLIPVDQWASKIDLNADIGLFRALASFDTCANHAVYLCAQVVDLLSQQSGRHHGPISLPFSDRWRQIWRFVQDWELRRPAEMLPVTIIPNSTLTPFPTILYSNPAAISGNQLFHTACILLLQNRPSQLRIDNQPRSIQWHARQVCGISLSNDHHGAWTNSIQPLWIAGKCMSRPEEQRAILDHLCKIETESGWGTKWRMQDLQEYWKIEYG